MRTFPAHNPSERRHDLDWLRIIAFLFLIFYHTGMGFVTWDWHVKSAQAGPEGEWLMQLVSPWRLSLLFFISGVAVRFMSDRMSPLAFAGERSWRLFVPLLFGALVIVAPQTYFQLRQAGHIEPGYLAFWRAYLHPDPMFGVTTPTWNHLWYVAYLLVYCLIIAVTQPLLRPLADRLLAPAARLWTGRAGVVALLLVPILPFLLIRFTLTPHFPTTHDLVEDWANHAQSFTIFLIGYFAARSPRFWQGVSRAWPWALALAVALAITLSWVWARWDTFAEGGLVVQAARIGRVSYAWLVILCFVGLGQRFLNRPSGLLTHLTARIFPIYILHQTITVTLVYLIAAGTLGWGKGAEFALVAVGTLAGSYLGAELIARIPLLRPLFGMPLRTKRVREGLPQADAASGRATAE